MKRKFNLHQLKKLRALTTNELRCIKGGKKKDEKKGSGTPPLLIIN